MKEIEEIVCSGCGEVRRWRGSECLDTCPCLAEQDYEEPIIDHD